MKFTLSWLKDHLETDAPAAAIAARLTAIGLEVESLSEPGADLKDFVVGEVKTAVPHPNADRLRLCSVNDGKNELQVVCGAPNARAGIKVVLAKPGTVIPTTGQALKVGAIRGVESRGMMCSARELGLGEDHDGIMELPASAVVGGTILPALVEAGLLADDPLFDVAITPNRGDCASVVGIARELAASGLGRLKTTAIVPVAGSFPSPKTISLKFSPADSDACPIFAGRLIRGVKNGPAPKWVQDRFKAVGLKSISALVDATNLISHDRGRPLHVFDADRLAGNMSARMAQPHEQVLALDEQTYVLDDKTIVIADDSFARSIAGIMGGLDTGSFDNTVNVFIESAIFDPARIARAGQRLGIISDARYRFERGVDPAFVLGGLELCTRLILEWCGGEASDVVIAGELPPSRKPILFDPDFVQRLGAITVPVEDIRTILEKLGFAVVPHDQNLLSVTPPSWRHDIDGPADLVEEVVRIRGLADVPATPLPRHEGVAAPVLSDAQRRTRTARRAIAVRGFNECVSFSFISRAQAALFGGGDDARQLANPIAADLDALRPALLPNLLAAVSRNAARGLLSQALFEVGPAFETGAPGGQQTLATGLRTGQPERHWQKNGQAPDVFAAKADTLAVLEAVMGSPMSAPVSARAPSWYHPGRSATIALGPKVIACFGELHPKILAAFDLKGPASAFEIFLDALPPSKHRARAAFTPSPYQASHRDFAFVVKKDIAADAIIRAARLADRTLIDQVSLFDVYEGAGVAPGHKSVAIAVRIQPQDKTLTDAEIEAIAARVVAGVTKATGASLRR